LHAFEEDSTVIEVTEDFICSPVVQSIPLVAAYSFPRLMTYVSFVTPLASGTLRPPTQAIKILTSKARSRCGIYETAWFIPTETMATISALHYYARWLLCLDNALLLVPVTRMRKENGVVWLGRPDLPKVEYDARF
jgi:hypothetical protein